MLKYALIAVTMSGPHMEMQPVMRGWETLTDCLDSAGHYQMGQISVEAVGRPVARFICVPDGGPADDALFAEMQ